MTPLIGGVGHEASSPIASSRGGFLLGAEISQMMLASTNHNLCGPLFIDLVPVDATEGRGTSSARDILHVARLDGSPKIGSTVVQPIPVDVVAFSPITVDQAEQGAVKANLPLGASVPRCHTDYVALVNEPSPLTYPICIIRIDKCVGANRSVAGVQRDTYGILVRHRDLLNSARGVRPGVVQPTFGLLALNYTRSLQGERD